MSTCQDVANFFIANKDADDEMTMLKLQKLCAYAQAFSLALLGKPLFPNALRAYTHGPVVRELLDYPLNMKFDKLETRSPFNDEELFVLETVSNYYGAYSASKLRNMSHEDFPVDFNSHEAIDTENIKKYFENNKVIKAIKEAFK